jgi:N-methylhydantoinase B
VPAVDAITFEVLKHRLWQITDEQAVTIKTISSSPIVVEGNDFNVGIFTSDGRVITAGIGSLVHVTTMGSTIESILRVAGVIRPGDVFLTNDPFLGALHQNDVVVASPLFVDGSIVLWVGNVLHYPDVGGIDEGSFCINARSLYQEPPRYFLKIVDRGEFSPEVERTFVTNSRLPDAVALDLRSQIGAINVAERRMRELIEECGLETVLAVAEQSLALAEEALRERLTTIHDGDWETDVYMDGPRVGSDALVRVHVQLKKRGDRLHFDYTGSDPQVDAAVNSTHHATYAGSVVPVYTFICGGDIDWNDAVKRCVDVVAPAGTVVNATFPAPVSICTVGFRWLVTVAASRVVAEMLAASGTMRDRVCSSWSVSANCNNVFGVMSNGARVGALLSDHRAGGAAGRSFGDGFSHAGQTTSFSSNVANVESVEWKLPLLYLYRRQLPDSGGPGRYRGGLTAESALVPFGTEQLILKSTNTAGADESNASGIDGGYPGAGSQVMIAHGVDVTAAFAAGRSPLVDLLQAQREFLPSKAESVLGPCDVLIFHPPGGGGYGDPLERESAAVADDFALGRVTRAGAERFYGVIFDASGSVDFDRTAQGRAALRRDRVGGAFAERGPWGGEALARRVGDALDLVGSNHQTTLRCRRCGCTLGPTLADGTAARQQFQPLAAAGPWLARRWDGHSPNFDLREVICPGCGQMLDVQEHLRLTAAGVPAR